MDLLNCLHGLRYGMETKPLKTQKQDADTPSRYGKTLTGTHLVLLSNHAGKEKSSKRLLPTSCIQHCCLETNTAQIKEPKTK